MKIQNWIVLSIIFLMVLGACTPQVAAPSDLPMVTTPTAGSTHVKPDQPVSSGNETPKPGNTSINPIGPIAAEALAKQLGVDVQTVKVTGLELVDWPNTCLGVEKPGEACAEMIVSGYRVMLEVGGMPYEVHTNENGSDLRIVERTLQTGPLPTDALIPAVTMAVQALASQLGIEASQVKVVSYAPAEWSDGCLGLGGPAESCLMATVPGYRVNLDVNGRPYEVRTDLKGRQVRVNPLVGPETGSGDPAQTSEDVVLTFDRSGGIAGLCDHLEVTVGGVATATTCKAEPVQFHLNPIQMARLRTWAIEYASFDYHQVDPATADAMRVDLIFVGSGSQNPSAEQQAEIVSFAVEVFGQDLQHVN